MTKKNPYKSFPNFVLRTPLFSFSFFKELTSNEIISDEDFRKLFGKDEIKEAVFLATPILYDELVKWLNEEVYDSKKIEKLKLSLFKYLSRMSSRCTPFGLFAGCAVGSFSNESSIRLNQHLKNNRHTRLDMNYLVALSQDLAKNNNIKKQILYYPNTSIYYSGNQLRYIEFEYFHGKRIHHITGVDFSIYLEKVLLATETGLLFNDIVDLLIDEENSKEAVEAFVDELIESQILINELEPFVSGPEFLDHILGVLSKIKGADYQLEILKSVKNKLLNIDEKFGNDIQSYIDISVELENLGTDFDIKYLFQTDVVLLPEKNILDKSVIESVKKGLSLFNKITIPQKETVLNSFKDAFYERFEEREIVLSKALDVEVGIGYKQNKNSFDINPLVDDIVIPHTTPVNHVKDLKWSVVNTIFNKKFIIAFENNDYSIQLKDEDFIGFEENWDDLADTISSMIEIVVINGKQKILINSAGGSSAANLLGRFCHGDHKLNEHTQKITKFEQSCNKDKILAEIVHLPESRVGNVLMRPIFREYEIPYLAKSMVGSSKQLLINDLYVSVRNNKVVIKSKMHNKEVIPKLTTAHNYNYNSLPIYHFLSEMQTQDKRIGIGVNLGPFAEEYEFLPRIEYYDLIFSQATWNFKKKDVDEIINVLKQEDLLLQKIRNFRLKKRIPQYILLVDGDHELLVNLENLISVKMFLNTIKNKTTFKIKEFLYEESGVVKNEISNDYFTNQVILSFYNSNKGDHEY